MESPSGMIRTGVAAWAVGTAAIAYATAAASTVSAIKTAGLFSIVSPCDGMR
jgi:hypothetical protein